MAGAGTAADGPPLVVPALSVAHEEQLLIRKILTEQQFGSHVTEITFPGGPVVLTSVRVGSVPSSGAQLQRAHLLLFAADAAAPASARLLQLCPGFEQPESGTRVVQLQPCMTTRVLLRGQYQTVPLSLFGYSLEQAAAAAPPLHQRRLTIAGALQWLRNQQEQQAEQQAGAAGPAAPLTPGAGIAAPDGLDAAAWEGAPLQPTAEAALAGLVEYWEEVGTSERLMALHPPPAAAFKASGLVADAVCHQLVVGTFGRQPLPAGAPEQEAAQGDQQQQAKVAEGMQEQQQEAAQGRQEEQQKDAGQGTQEQQQQQNAAKGTEEQQQQNAAEGTQPQEQQPSAVQQEQQQQQQQQDAGQGPRQPANALRGEALLDAAADMVLGWCGMLGGGAQGRTVAAMRCSAAGLAAAVLLCSYGDGARVMVARGLPVLLDDVCSTRGAPPSFVRHAITACLLIARCCGALGGAALLGMWKPPRGIVWQSRRRQRLLASESGRRAEAQRAAGTTEGAAAAAAPAAAGGGADAEDAPAEMAADEEDDEQAAAAAVAAAAAEMEQGLYDAPHSYSPSHSEDEEEAEEGGEPGPDVADGAAGLALQRRQQERAAQLAEEAEQLLWGSASEDEEEGEEDVPGYADEVLPPEEDEQAAAAGEAGRHALPPPQQQDQPSGGQGAVATGAAAAAGQAAASRMEVDEFGEEVLAGPSPHPSPAPQAEAAGSGGADAELVDAELAGGDDDLYGDLDLGGPSIPQVDGAADSPPRHRRSRSSGADPSERWEMGAEEGSPAEHGKSGRARDRSRERDDGRRKDRKGKEKKEKKEKRKSKERSREQDSKKERRRRDSRERSPSSRRERDREHEHASRAAEEQRRQQLREAEEQEQRRQRLREEQARRMREEEARQKREAEVQRRRQQEDEARRSREAEAQRRRQQEDEVQRRRRYQEQQRRLEEESKRVEEEARRRKQQAEAEEEARRRRKRERSPVPLPAPGAGERRKDEPDGKHPRTDRQPHAQRPAGPAEQKLQQQQQQQQQQQPRKSLPQQAAVAAAAAAAAKAPAIASPRQGQLQRKVVKARPIPQDEAGRWALHEQQQTRRMNDFWLQKQRSFGGVSVQVARHLLSDVQPPRLALAARQLLHLLRAHEAAAAFQAAARRLVAAHNQPDERGRQAPPPGMPTPEASMLVAECCSSLQQLAELLAKPLPTSSDSGGGTDNAPDLRAQASEPPPPLLDAVRSRRLLPLLAAALHVPALHRAWLEAAAPAAAVAPPQAAAVVEAALAQQLGLGAKALLAVLASSRGGRAVLLGEAGVVEALLEATDAGCLAAGWQAGAGAEGAAVLQHVVVGEAVAAQLCDAALDSKAFAVAAETAAAMLRECGPSGRRALLQAVALRGAAAVPRLLLMMRMHCALLRAACGTGAATFTAPASPAAAQQRMYEPDLELLLAAAPACAPAGQLLLALLTATHPDVLSCWQHHAVAMRAAADAELRLLAALPEPAAALVGGLGAARSVLASLRGGVGAVAMMQQPRGLSLLLTHLGAELPQLVAHSAQSARREGVPTGARTVVWPSVEALFCDPEKLACCEQCLRLLASQLWAPGAAGREAAYTLDEQEGLAVLLRGVLTGAELVVASAADDAWQALAGHSIDVGEAAACRRRALSFLEAAAAAMSCLMQHLRGSTCTVKSRSLLAGLLRAHSVLCCQEESLACMLGGASSEGAAGGAAAGVAASGMQGVLVARYHLASCLRCYVEAASPWQPPLLQQVFWGTPAPGLEPGRVAAQTPAEMFVTACLLGDLFPPEWPAVGRKAMQAPPADRRYRAALATAIEPCGASFRRLIAAALTSESRLLRAAVVRVLARAAGLGGGMGPFLVEPLLEELTTVAESPAPLHDARRLLEVIVPLVYRPALKSAMLATRFTSTLAQLLGVVVGKLSSGDEGGEALHVCTMAMEAVVVLFNSEVCLNPLAPLPQQQVEDMPTIQEAVPMARALLELLPGMGGNAMIAHRVLRLMAAADGGRLALRRAVVSIHAAATGAEQPSDNPGAIAVAQAAQWMANRYWAAAERLGTDATTAAAGGLDGLRSVYVDMVTIMQQICIAVDEDSMPRPPSAQQRFVAALQAARHAAAEAGLDVGGDEHRWEAPGASEARAADLVYDPATRMFWRNVRARAATQSQASSAHAMRRFARRECKADPDISLATSLHPPLTLPRQPPELPPAMEQPTQRQQPQVKEAPQERGSHHGRAGTASALSVPAVRSVSAASPVVKAEPAPQSAPPQPLQSTLQSMDLYADLGANLHARSASSAAQLQPATTTASPWASGATQDQRRQEQQQQQQQQRRMPTGAAVQQHVVVAAEEQRRGGKASGIGGNSEPAQQQVEATSSGSLQALLSNKDALQALLKDPIQLRRLLEKHPTLITLLKSTLGQK